jgi:uncharacterized membrane protein YeaQ/YmgE (transglycosylase-associated protein family)
MAVGGGSRLAESSLGSHSMPTARLSPHRRWFAHDGWIWKGDIDMSVLGWILLGLISGFVASKIVNRTGEGVLLDIVLGVVGAFVGGFLFNLIGSVGVTGFNVWSMFVSVIGAVVVLVLYHALFRRRALV